MKKLSFNQGTLIFDNNQARLELPIQTIYFNQMDEIKKIHDMPQIAFPCKIKRDTKQLIMEFSIEEGYVPFQQARKETTDIKLKNAYVLVKLGSFFESQPTLITVFNPINFYINKAGDLKILYRGIKGLMPAEGFDDDPLLDQVKRLLLFLFSGARYEELRINGLSFAKSKAKAGNKRIISGILDATSFQQLSALIEQEQKEYEIVKEEQEKQQEQQKKVARQSWIQYVKEQKNMLIIVGCILFLSTVCAYFIGVGQGSKTRVPMDDRFFEGLRLASTQQYDKASEKFDKVNFDSLSAADKRIVLFSLLYTGNVQKALDMDDLIANDVVKYYIITDQLSEIKTLKSDHPAIRFEQAGIDKNHSLMIELKKDVLLDQRRREMIVQSYLTENKIEEAKTFIRDVNDDKLMKLVNEHQEQ